MNRPRQRHYIDNDVAIPWTRASAARESRPPTLVFDANALPIAKIVGHELAAIWATCGPFECVALGYLALTAVLITIFAQNLAHPMRLILIQTLVAALILLLSRGTDIVWSPASHASALARKFWHFWRHWYPHLFFLFCFEELAYLVHLVSPNWQDPKLIAFDHWLTGLHPSIWLEQFATPAHNEFMQFAYITYFTYLLVLGGILYHRKDWLGYWSVMTYSGIAYAIGYTIAIFFPIESPWFAMAGSWHNELRGGVFTAVINCIEHYGRVRGAAFPSEHVAGSLAALWGAWRHRRWLFWIMLPLVLCMCVATVYGRYHYVADVFCGTITGTIGYLIGGWLMKQTASGLTSKDSLAMP